MFGKYINDISLFLLVNSINILIQIITLICIILQLMLIKLDVIIGYFKAQFFLFDLLISE